MRNRLLALCTLGMVVACSAYSSSDGDGTGTQPPGTNPGTNPDPTNPHPDAPPTPEVTPPEDEVTEKYGYFVTEKGEDVTGDGTRTKPLRSIGAALAKAKLDGKRVYVCNGKYPEAVTLENGITIIGGYDCSDAMWKNSPNRSQIVSPSSPALRSKGIVAKTRVERLDIASPDATTASESSFGFIAEGTTGLTIANTRIVAGSGAPGTNGTPAVQLTSVVKDAGIATTAARNCLYSPQGICLQEIDVGPGTAAGATNTCNGAVGKDGIAGGHGGSPAVFTAKLNPVTGHYYWSFFAGTNSDQETKSGLDGAPGQDGQSAMASNAFSPDGFATGDGTKGTDGSPGDGGSGTPGVPPSAEDADAHNSEKWHGHGGGGGGAGGCPGLAGGAGTGGGASVAVLLFESPVAFEKSEIQSGNGGLGGRGTFASDPSPGTYGGLGGGFVAATGVSGGAGGRGGISGAGAGGPTYAIAFRGAEPKLTTTTTDTGRGGSGRPEESYNTRKLPASGDGAALPKFQIPQ